MPRRIISPIFLIIATLLGLVNHLSFAGNSSDDALLSRSIFNEEHPPQNGPWGNQYNTILVSLVASIKSRQPKRDETQWIKVSLPPGPQSIHCPNAVRGFFKKSTTGSPYTFVVLPGAYSTRTHGSFSNQISDILNRKFHDPNILSFAGHRSPHFLKGVCTSLPPNDVVAAKDLYPRIKTYLRSTGALADHTGLVGFSGGALVAINMLGEDGESPKRGGDRVFGLGGMAFSPILNVRTVFNILDTHFRNSSIDSDLTLTNLKKFRANEFDWGNMRNMISGLFRGLVQDDWRVLTDEYASNPDEFVERAFNEFVTVDLVDALVAVGADEEQIRKWPVGYLSYHHVYIDEIYSQLSEFERDRLFDEDNDLRPVLAKIDRPLFVYFSKDDPILSNANNVLISDYRDLQQPEVISDILDQARKNPMITVFNPSFGAHAGSLLDPIFEELVTAFFEPKLN